MSGETRITPAPIATERQRTPERREIPSFSRQDTLQARLACPGENYSFLNPANREVPALAAEAIIPHASDALIQLRSNQERQRTARGSVDTWKTAMARKFESQESKNFFESSEKGKRFAKALNDGLGIDVTHFSMDKINTFYNDFCTTSDGKNGAIAYADKIIASYKDKPLKELEDNLDAFTWMATTLGSETSEILAQRISMIKRAQSTHNRSELVQTVNTDNKINKPSPQEVKLLAFLYGDGKNLPLYSTEKNDTTQSDTTTDQDSQVKPYDASENEPILEVESTDETYLNEKIIDPDIKKSGHDLAEIFKKLKYKNIDQARIGDWYITNPPVNLGTLRDDEIRGIIPADQKPFFIPGTSRTNDEMIPHVWDFMVDNDYKKEVGLIMKYPNSPVNRFIEAANRLTEDDSSLIALSSVASSDEDKQAQVYANIARILVDSFRRFDIYKEWLTTQNNTDNGIALQYYMREDHKWVEEFDDRYRALPVHKGGKEDGMLDSTSVAWNSRLNELDEAIKQKKYTLYHHRWLETMSKAVDIRKVFALIKKKQTP